MCIGTHVDDMLWAANDEVQKIIDNVLAEFDIREARQDDFGNCGLEVSQDSDLRSLSRLWTISRKSNQSSIPVASAGSGMVFKGGTVSWNTDMVLLTVTDASWSNESVVTKGELETSRSQKARFNGLTGPGLVEGDRDVVNPLCISSKVIRRVCK